MEKVICFECGKTNDYELRKSKRKYKGDGYEFELDVEVPFCKNCGALITIEEIESEITKKANEKIRESRGIVKREEIIDILSKYNVSQKFLSRLLGWGEITLTRYISGGYTPNKVNSDKLKGLKDPYVFQKLLNEKLEENNEINNASLVQKLQISINRNIEEVENTAGKIFEVINWFLSQSTNEVPVTHLALQKLLYFSQAWNKMWNGEWLFQNDCEAWVHGAVYRNVYDEFKKFKYHPLPKIDVEVQLSKKEVEVLQFVKKYYFDIYSAKSLETICHEEEPYKLARKGCKADDSSNQVIKKEDILEYYTTIAEKYDISIKEPEKVKKYLNDLLA